MGIRIKDLWQNDACSYSGFIRHALQFVIARFNGKVAYDVTHFAPKNWLIKSSNLCWRGIGRTPTFGFILKTNEKLIKIWNELLLVGLWETNTFENTFDKKQFG